MLDRDWNHGGGHAVQGGGKPCLRDLMNGLHGVASLTVLRAIGPGERSDGMLVRVIPAASEPQMWKWVDASTLTHDGLLVATPTDAPTTGRWIRVDKYVDLALAVTKDTADAAVLFTVPVGFRLQLGIPWWEVTTSWTGGSASAIGLSSSNTPLSTKGDLLGGTGGDVAAGLLSTGALAKGTIGTDINKPIAFLVAGDTIRFDQIVSIFTAGVGIAHVPVFLVATP